MATEKIPFIISVTGHRDLADGEIIRCRKKVETILKYFCELKTLKHTPVWVFSSLSDGADRCVAEVALALRETGRYDIRVIAPLPLERDIYIQDFSESSIQGFDHLLEQMDDSFVLDPYEYDGFDTSQLSLPEPDNRTAENNWGYSPERNAQYVNLGAFLVRHANILLTLWDGNISASLAGGTSEVVMAMLNQPMDWGRDNKGNIISPREELRERKVITGGESGAVIHIPVKRKHIDKNISMLQLDNQRPKWANHWPNNTIKWYFSCGFMSKDGFSGLIQHSQNELHEIIKKINAFNSELSNRTTNRSSDEIEKQLNTSWLQPVKYQFSQAVDRIRSCYRSADWCALNMQIKKTRIIKMFFFSILMTVISYEIFKSIGADGSQPGFYSLLSFLASIVVVTGTIIFSKKVEYKRKFHDFRIYAELMRVSSYLSYLGINKKMIELFSPDTRSMTAWLEHARRAAEYQTWNRNYSNTSCSNEDMKNIKEWWINDQLAYYAVKIGDPKNRNSKQNLLSRLKLIRILSIILYMLGGGVTCYIAFYYFKGVIIVADYSWLNALFFGSSAAVAKWGDLQGYKDDAARYTLARDMYQWAGIEFDELMKSNDLPRLKNVMLELAKQAISENTRWYISQSARNVSIEMK